MNKRGKAQHPKFLWVRDYDKKNWYKSIVKSGPADNVLLLVDAKGEKGAHPPLSISLSNIAGASRHQKAPKKLKGCGLAFRTHDGGAPTILSAESVDQVEYWLSYLTSIRDTTDASNNIEADSSSALRLQELQSLVDNLSIQKEDMQKRLRESEKTNTALRVNQEAGEKHFRKMTSYKEKLKSVMADYKIELNAIIDLKEELRLGQKQIVELQESVGRAQSLAAQLKSENAAMVESQKLEANAAQQALVDSLNQKNDKLQHQQDTLLAERKIITAALQDLTVKSKRLAKQNRALRADNENSQKETLERQSQTKAVQDKTLAKLRLQLESTSDKLVMKDQEVNTLKAALAVAKREVSDEKKQREKQSGMHRAEKTTSTYELKSLAKTNNELKERIVILEKNISDRDALSDTQIVSQSELLAIQAKLAETQKKLDIVQTTVADAQAEAAAAREEAAIDRALCNDAEGRSYAIGQERDATNVLLEKVKNSWNESKRELQHAIMLKEELQRANEQLMVSLEATEMQLMELRGDSVVTEEKSAKQLEIELKEANLTLEKTNAKLQQVEEQMKPLSAKVRKLEKERTQSAAHSTIIVEELESLQNQIDALNEEKKELEEKLANFDAEKEVVIEQYTQQVRELQKSLDLVRELREKDGNDNAARIRALEKQLLKK